MTWRRLIISSWEVNLVDPQQEECTYVDFIRDVDEKVLTSVRSTCEISNGFSDTKGWPRVPFFLPWLWMG